MTEFKINDAVIVDGFQGGIFYGRVTGTAFGGNGVTVTPDSPDLQLWYPKGYSIGRSHYGTSITHREESTR